MRALAGLAFTARAASELRRRSDSYDVIVTLTNPPAAPLAASFHKATAGTPYVYLVHDLYPDIAVAMGKLSSTSATVRAAHAAQRSWLHSAHTVVVLGRCMAERLRNDYQVPDDKIRVIPNWFSEEHVDLPHDVAWDWADAGVEGFVLLYAGNIGQHLHLDSILGAARQLESRSSDVTFVFVGDGPQRSELSRRVREEEHRNVRLFDRVDQKVAAAMTAAADAVFVPLPSELTGLGVPSKFYSGLAAGIPAVVAADSTTEMAATISSSGGGVVTAFGSADGLADAVVSLTSDPAARAAMGDRARNYARAHLSLTSATSSFYELLREFGG